jgi:zinc and cadmium transporter
MNSTLTTWLYAISSVILVSLVSFVGIFTLAVSGSRLKQAVFAMVSLAVGAMFGDAFIHLLPESFGNPRPKAATSLYVLSGIFAFFFLEKFLLWRHQHTFESDNHIHPVGYMNLIADGVHNLMDGVLIGASYLISPHVGLATTAAVLLHEIPQEIGDFGVLLHAGFTIRRALLFNFLSATLAIAGTLIALTIGSGAKGFVAVVLPLGAGGFIYIAGSDLIPELHKELTPSKSLLQLVSMAVGVGLMLLLTLLD